MKRGGLRRLLWILGILVMIQFLRYEIKQVVFAFVGRSMESDVLASMGAMVLLTALFLVFMRWQRVPLSVFPRRFSWPYIAATVVAGGLITLSPGSFAGGAAVVSLVYGSIVTPVFEELIFRGYVWNQLKTHIRREWVVYLLTAALFGLWHLGYWDSVAFRARGVDQSLWVIMAMKALVGLGYGLVLGALRLWAKNCYATMLLHGVMNVFGR